MHNTAIEADDGLWTFIHNGDYSGDVRIVGPSLETIDIPNEVLVEFIGQQMLQREVDRMEQLSGTQYLTLARFLAQYWTPAKVEPTSDATRGFVSSEEDIKYWDT